MASLEVIINKEDLFNHEQYNKPGIENKGNRSNDILKNDQVTDLWPFYRGNINCNKKIEMCVERYTLMFPLQ